MFNYKKLLQKKKILENELPQEIKQVIDTLNDLEQELSDDLKSDDTDPDDIKEIKNRIMELDSKVCELIIEDFDDEMDEDEPDTKQKERILASFYEKKQTEVSLAQLKSAHYPTEHLENGEKVGAYRISLVAKKFMKPFYRITKLG